MKIPFNDIVLWTESTIVLAWIKKDPSVLKPFVKNRVSVIQHLTEVSSWKHVQSQENPADIISRGIDPDKIQDCVLWWGIPKVRQSSNLKLKLSGTTILEGQANPNIRDHWALRCMKRCPDLGVCLKRDVQCLRSPASLVLIYRPNVAGMKGRVNLSQPVNRTPVVWKHDTLPLEPIR
ncbi:DUF1758 domain-containing protein [Trichonephila clavipes]|nr:DUF1758 domain-containing protein [Trichonephila clavipes]